MKTMKSTYRKIPQKIYSKEKEQEREQVSKDLGPSTVFCMVESNFLQTKIALRNLIIIII
jgi:hypothetical protein